jgi:zinc/manganese transport system permease protein
MIDILLSAFFLSIILLGIHSYFGLEIIRRGIIFTDLAIGQMAAFGAALSILFLHGEYLYPISLAFALLSGYTISMIARRERNPEPFIGLLYAFGLAGVYIILSKSAHGMETFQKLMAADILFTPSEEIIKTAALYAGLGLFIFFFQRKTKGHLRDLLFFVTFAATVTSSVKLAGVLIVFALLLAPALIAIIIGKGIPLITAWIIGTIINIIAIIVSYSFDFPTGYTIVFFNALAALLVNVLCANYSRKPQCVPGREDT